MLNEKQIKEYEEKGFTILDYQLSDSDLDEIKSMHDNILKKYPEFRDYCPTLLKYDRNFLKYAQDPEILNCVKQLIGPNLAVWNQSFFAKPGINGKETPWHQDGAYWPIRPLATCTVWLAVDDSNIENGCLKYMPGSHKRQDLKKHKTDNSENYTLNQEIDPSEYKEDKAFQLQLKAGQMALHDAYIVHGSGVNTSPNSRRGMTIRYMPTTSVFDRKLAADQEKKFNLDHAHRTLYLMSGIDQSGKNDFIVRN
jgi:ectoine hydroxylase-related dioxygenase (phytanoyl-CoA dioxygenase family)